MPACLAITSAVSTASEMAVSAEPTMLAVVLATSLLTWELSCPAALALLVN